MKKYECDPCDFLTYLKHDYNRHLLSKKHQTNCPTVQPTVAIKTTNSPVEPKPFPCADCRESFPTDNDLKNHKETCPVALRIKVMLLEKDKENIELKKE